VARYDGGGGDGARALLGQLIGWEKFGQCNCITCH